MSYLEGDSLLKEIEKSLESQGVNLEEEEEDDDSDLVDDREEEYNHLNDLINLNKARKRVQNFDNKMTPDSESFNESNLGRKLKPLDIQSESDEDF